MARLLCDECVPRDVSDALAADGHDVVLVRDRMRGAIDEQVVAFAHADGWAVVTEDRRFGQIGLATGEPAGGIVVLAMGDAAPSVKAARAVQVLRDVGDILPGALVVVTARRVRRRELLEP